MSKKKLAGIIGSCIVVVVVIVIIATLGPKPVTDYSTLLRYLRDSGASIEEKGEMHESAVFNLFDVEGKRVTVNGSSIYVFEYANAVAMELEASCASPDGFGMTKGNRAQQVSWINPPHFYKAGRIIVFYCGYNESIISLLENALGTQFAGMSLPSMPEFSINVTPEKLNGDSITGQHCVFLVTITDEGDGCEIPVTISATAPGAEVVVYKEDIFEGKVAEVVVIPSQASIGTTIDVTITGNRGSASDEKIVSFEVAEGEDDRKEYARDLLDKFVSWLSANHPVLGITEDTAWNGTMVSPVWLVVSHYLFFSEDWEAHISWHVMVPPHDWAKIDLRHRFNKLEPSYAFEISSLNATSEPVPIEPPETVWR
jgi:hypothetical protein